MARYAKIDRRMFGDEKYRRLTAPQPCGQVLWWHLLAGKQTGIIPGLYSIGEAAFSEQLGWSLKGFREGFQEVFREGMAKADWEAPLVWVPNSIRYNPPANPNVVTSWKEAWDELPECELKHEAYQRLKAFVEGLSKGFREAFQHACPNPFRNPLGNHEHEQEHEHEHEHDSPPTPQRGEGKPARKASPEACPLFARFWSAYPRKVKKPDAAKAFAKHEPDEPLLAVMLAAVARQSRSEDWAKDGGKFIPYPASWLNSRRWEDEPVTRPPPQETPEQIAERQQRIFDSVNRDTGRPNPLLEHLKAFQASVNGTPDRQGGPDSRGPDEQAAGP